MPIRCTISIFPTLNDESTEVVGYKSSFSKCDIFTDAHLFPTILSIMQPTIFVNNGMFQPFSIKCNKYIKLYSSRCDESIT